MLSPTAWALHMSADDQYANRLTFPPHHCQDTPMFPLSPSLADERAADFADFLDTASEDDLRDALDYQLDEGRFGLAEAIREALFDRFSPPE